MSKQEIPAWVVRKPGQSKRLATIPIIEDGKGYAVAHVLGGADKAEIIVRAVNSFAAAENLAKALQVIQVAINDGDGGPYWPAREFLKKHNIYDGDLNDLRVLGAVCEAALSAFLTLSPS